MNNSENKDELIQEFKPIILSPRNPEDIKIIKQLKENVGVLVFDTIALQVKELLKIDNPMMQMGPEQFLVLEKRYYFENH